jgi:hypothetical protein
MAKLPHQRALDILRHRCGEWSRVFLTDGRSCMVHNVAWGYDLGDDVAHMTTNVSPPDQEYDVAFHYESDFFHADQIVKIEAVDTGALLFDLSA